jgi:hypothetical protein
VGLPTAQSPLGQRPEVPPPSVGHPAILSSLEPRHGVLRPPVVRGDVYDCGGDRIDGGVAAPATSGVGKTASLDSRAASALSRLAGSDAAALPNLEFGSSPGIILMAQLLDPTAPRPVLRFGRRTAATSPPLPLPGSLPPPLGLSATKSPLGQRPAVPPTVDWVLVRWPKCRQLRMGLPAATSPCRQRSAPDLVSSNERAG